MNEIADTDQLNTSSIIDLCEGKDFQNKTVLSFGIEIIDEVYDDLSFEAQSKRTRLKQKLQRDLASIVAF